MLRRSRWPRGCCAVLLVAFRSGQKGSDVVYRKLLCDQEGGGCLFNIDASTNSEEELSTCSDN